MIVRQLGISGTLDAKVIRDGVLPTPIGWKPRNILRWGYIWGWLTTRTAIWFSHLTGIPTITAELRGLHIRPGYAPTNLGVLGRRVVTTAFVNYLVDQLQTETSTFGDFKYHDSGVGTTGEAVGDTGIETTDGESRATGTQTESAANAYRSVATITYTSTKAITEHGLFNDATAGTLLDRTVFAAKNVVAGEAIQFTHTLTVNSSG